MKKIAIILFSLILFTAACGPQGVLYEYQDTKIVFGSGGGFTGQVTEYHLDARGNLKMVESLSGEEAIMGKVKKSDLKAIYSALSDLDLSKADFNHPGNMYYFIEEVNTSKSDKVIWGDPEKKAPEGLQELYDLLISSMN